MPFKAQIYKVGINPCVEVPASVTSNMKPIKGYIPVIGKINGYEFMQTLVPVKGALYRLYVNFIMLKGGKAKLGDVATFSLKQDLRDRSKVYKMAPALKKQLTAHGLTKSFNALSEARRKDILKYLSGVKTEETMTKNVNKVIDQLKRSVTNVRIP